MTTKSQGDQIRDPIAGAAGNVKDFFVDDVTSGLQTAGQSIAGIFGFDVGGGNEPAPNATPQEIVAMQQAAANGAMGGAINPANYWNSPGAKFEGMPLYPGGQVAPGTMASQGVTTKDPLNPFDLSQAGIDPSMTPEELQYYQQVGQFVEGFNQDPSKMRISNNQGQGQGQGGGGSFTDPFGNKISSLEAQRRDSYEALFADQEGAAADKYESITAYLDDLGAGQQEQYQIDMQNMSQQYDQMQSSRNERFAEAYASGADRSGLALDTLASLGIEPNLNTFSSVTGETQDMLFSQQQSGADMLNTMRLISTQMLDFGASSASKTISAGLQQAEMNFAEEMANIQLARHSQAINDLDAQIAQEKANQKAAATLARAREQEAKMNQYYVTLGASLPIPLGAQEAIAAGNTGAFDYYLKEAFAPLPEEPAQDPVYSLAGGSIEGTEDQIRLMMDVEKWLSGDQPQGVDVPLPGQFDSEGNPVTMTAEDLQDYVTWLEINNNSN